MRVTFDDSVELATVPGPDRLFRLRKNFEGTIDGAPFTIPSGFLTDLASVPQVFQNVVLNNDPTILRPSILHDWLYQTGGTPRNTWFKFTRAQADEILREGMAECGAGWCRRWTVWSAVRLGGGRAWQMRHARRLELGIRFFRLTGRR